MDKVDYLKNEIETLPPPLLMAVESFIKKLKNESEVQQKASTLLSDLAENAIDDILPGDLAEQHDHYLYGTSKR